jgi:hypothetical protein
MSRIVIVILIYHGHKPIDRITVGLVTETYVFSVRYLQTYRVEF